jgi:DNA-binding NarL/FixJ family response regulator
MIANDDLNSQVPAIRVLVANLSGVMSEIVLQAIQKQPDMIVSHHVKDLTELSAAVGDHTDVLMIGAPYVYPPPTVCHELWVSFPKLKVLVLTPSGDAAVIYWLTVRQKRLKTVSASTLANAIRQVQRLDFTDE